MADLILTDLLPDVDDALPSGLPKLRIPFAIGDGTSAETVPQDSVTEIAQCVWAILATPKGERDTDPDFGLTEQAFREGGVDLEEVRALVERYEPRAEILTDSVFTELLQTVEVRVNALR